jgi:hypothetical protein
LEKAKRLALMSKIKEQFMKLLENTESRRKNSLKFKHYLMIKDQAELDFRIHENRKELKGLEKVEMKMMNLLKFMDKWILSRIKCFYANEKFVLLFQIFDCFLIIA